MPAKIHMNDGSAFIVNEPLENVERAYQEAVDLRGVLRITNGSGKVHVVNPAQVSYIEELTPEDAALQPEEVHSAEQVR